MSSLSSQRPVETLHVVATLQNLDAMHVALGRFWQACDALAEPPPAGMWRSAFDTAVGEIGANIVRHAYAGQPVAPVSLRLRLHPARVTACFADTGRPYRPDERREPVGELDDVMALPEGGMGLMIATAALDQLRSRRICGVNIWWLVKRRPCA